MAGVRLKLKVTGIVQGVGFRPFVYRIALQNGLNGYVRNRGDAGVEILLEGREPRLRKFLIELKTKKPPLAQIHEVLTSKLEGKDKYLNFTVEKSSNQAKLSGSIIPPDIAICNECLRELRNPENPRFEYFFITCTNCGPRFTIIEKLPYDRENTTMREFPMCGFCMQEYKDPLNRRFHAQTVACPECGPKVWLTNAKGKTIRHKDPVREAGKLLHEGNVLAIKGYGGFHVAASTTKHEPLTRLRDAKHRKQKPFAIMARSLEAAKTFAHVSSKEAGLLTSYSCPILLLNKRSDYSLSDLLAPGLHNIGVMLPYTGLHHMLFDKVDDVAFVMTSANPPNQPIIKDNDEALKTLADTVDYFLLHDRRIAHRCDDSVSRVHYEKQVMIRRSRGYAPAPIMLNEEGRHCALALGGELNNTVCLLYKNKAFMSQHIGDVENVETRDFLETAASHLVGLTNSRVETVVCDLHPKFTTTNLAHELAELNGWEFVQIQHHYAHVAALMMEHDVKEMIGTCCDGYGYGLEGEAWGGEILLCSREESGFERLAHLQKQPLVGGDVASRYPLRVVAGILNGFAPMQEWLFENKQHFPYGEKEIETLLQQLKNPKGLTQTTSCGRVLDAASAILGICYERTYEGEPSMKLESAAINGKDVLNLNPILDGDTLVTTQMLRELFERRKEYSVEDLGRSVHAYLAKGLAMLALEKAEETDVEVIGFTGGVAFNEILTAMMRKIVEDAGVTFLVHEAVPPGDGGLSFGQAAATGFFSS
jgi:hydrogenase maturation protein HypF